ncbi:MAG: tetratricopeptide repeat protein [Bdellovibrio sp.]|nr:tetratricopeptide repeat protein [Bdellovibrio sp.]
MNPLVILAILLLFISIAFGAKDNTPDLARFSFKEMHEIMEKSEVMYVVDTFEKHPDLLKLNFADELWPKRRPYLSQPWKFPREGGGWGIGEYPTKTFCPEEINAIHDEVFSPKHILAKTKAKLAPIITKFPNCFIAEFAMADIEYKQHNYENALALYDELLKKAPIHYRLHLYKADTYMSLKRYADARRSYVEALALMPRHETILKSLSDNKKLLKINPEIEPFTPRAFVRRESEKKIAIYVSQDGPEWLAYAQAKAIWLGEESYRKRFLEKDNIKWNSEEEFQSLALLGTFYMELKKMGKTKLSLKSERLVEIMKSGHLSQFILYEIGSRIDPYIMLYMNEEQMKEMRSFVEMYVMPNV